MHARSRLALAEQSGAGGVPNFVSGGSSPLRETGSFTLLYDEVSQQQERLRMKREAEKSQEDRPRWSTWGSSAKVSGSSSSSGGGSGKAHSFGDFHATRRTVTNVGVGFLMGSLVNRNVSASAAKIDVEQLLSDYPWPDEFPFRAQDFVRYDESRDTNFYAEPRFVTHIDDGAIKALTQFYADNLPASGQDDVAILDICSSWISHLPQGYTAGTISGLGMNEAELQANKQLTDFKVKDLNEDPTLPYADNSFDAVLNAVSVDYLTKPLQVFQEIERVLKPGGLAVMSFSNRCFPTKAIAIWTETGDPDHVLIVGSYFHYAGGFEQPKCKDISPAKMPFFGGGDPMYAVYSRKARTA